MAGKGDNLIKSLVDRVQRLKEERKGINDDIKDIFAEAKIHGLNVKVLREAIRLTEMSRDDLEERNTLIAEYGTALGFDLL